jgi:hypothetical protein
MLPCSMQTRSDIDALVECGDVPGALVEDEGPQLSAIEPVTVRTLRQKLHMLRTSCRLRSPFSLHH